MAYVDIVTVLAIVQFIYFGFKVGGARQKYGVHAPAVSGNAVFERHFRVQQNTLELLVVLVPGLYLFSRYFNPVWAAALGAVYLIGRALYAASYVRDPAKRGAGYGVSVLPTIILIVGAAAGATLQLLHH